MVLGDNLNGEMVLLDINIGVVTHSLHQSALNLRTSVISMVEDAELRVTALPVQVELPVFLLVEVNTPFHQLLYLAGGIAYHLLHRLAV